jgi:predicted membrane protein
MNTARHSHPMSAQPPDIRTGNENVPSNVATESRGLRWPNLLVGLWLMIVISVYPPLLTQASGQADHALAALLMWAMSAGLVSGVGFVPRVVLWRAMFSGWACLAALLLSIGLKFHA